MPRARRCLPFTLASATMVAAAASLSGQAIPIDLELGYRWVQVSGNDQMYRTQINDRPGVLLRSLNYTSDGPLGNLFDFAHVDGSDIGAGPAGQLRFEAGKVNLFKLTFTWRDTDLYSALPAFANPFLDQGIIPGQQTWNRTRNIYDALLELLPGKAVTPLLGYTRNSYQGPGTTTYHLGGNEFLLNQQVASIDELYRAGLGFNFGPVQGGFTQGWRQYRWHEVDTLAPGAGSGNVTTPIVGTDVTASTIVSNQNNKVNTPVTNAWVTANLFDRVKLIGSYVKADASSETNYVEADAGKFVSFEIARIFSGLAENVNSRARTDYWRGSARAEISVLPNVTVAGGWVETSRALDGQALISDLYINAVTYAGQDPINLLKEVSALTYVKSENQVYDANVSARMLGPFAVNAGWSQTHQTVTSVPDASEIILPEGQGGRFERTVNSYGGGASFAMCGVTLTGDYYHDGADQPIFRTDYIDRDRYKFRGLWNYNNWLRLGAFFQETRASDNVVQIGYQATVKQFEGDVEVSLLKNMLTLRGAGGEFLTDRQILIRVPQNFDIVPTYQREFGHNWEGGLHFQWDNFSIDGAYYWMNNTGSIPFTVDRARILAEFFFTANMGVDFEWLNDKYSEKVAFDQAGPLSNYNANRYYVGLHWRP